MPTHAPAIGDAPIAMRGSPSSLVGRLPLANSGAERLILRGAVLHVPGHDPVPVPMAVALRPGTTTDAPLRIDLGPTWPAGAVVGELEVGGTRIPVRLQVEPAIALDVSPGEVLAGEGRSKVELTVHNTGNVAIPLAVRTRGRLLAQDAGGSAPAGGSAVRVEPEGEPGGEPEGGLAREPGDHAGAEPGAEVECLLGEPVLLEPGASRLLTLQVVVPRGLDPTRRHRAILPVGPADLTVTVLPTDPHHE